MLFKFGSEDLLYSFFIYAFGHQNCPMNWILPKIFQYWSIKNIKSIKLEVYNRYMQRTKLLVHIVKNNQIRSNFHAFRLCSWIVLSVYSYYSDFQQKPWELLLDVVERKEADYKKYMFLSKFLDFSKIVSARES